MFRLTPQKREAIKPYKQEIQQNERTIATLQDRNKILAENVQGIIQEKPFKRDHITPIAYLLGKYVKPGKANEDKFLSSAEVHAYLREVAPNEADKFTQKQIGQGLTRLTKGSSNIARGTFGPKRGYWLIIKELKKA